MTNEKNPHALALAKMGASKGGKARAKKLTAEQRSEIARFAAEKRWGSEPIPQAVTQEGILDIGEAQISCYVLETGERILSTRGIMKSLKRTWRGRKHAGTRLPVFLEAKNLKPFISSDLDPVLSPVIFRTDTGARSEGYRAEVLPAVCDVYLKAREQGKLAATQEGIAQQCEILVRGLSKVGIIALVDEATGYQDIRARDALAKILEQFISEELRKWVRTFPPSFYKEMFRLWGLKYRAGSVRRPALIGKLTNHLVYERLAPGVLDELRRLTPRNEKGRLKRKLFQRLSEDVGHPKLREHLAAVTALMMAFDNKEDFMAAIDRSLPKQGHNLMLPFEEF